MSIILVPELSRTTRELQLNFIRAGTLLHVSGIISHLMQCHIRFLVMWRRESKVRERGGCLAKQPSHRLKFRSMRLLCTIVQVVVAMQLKYFFISSTNQGMWYNYETTKKTSHCKSCLVGRFKITCHCIRSIQDYVSLHETAFKTISMNLP